MAKFEEAVGIILRHEGGYVCDPDDSGGETNYGICKRSYPKLDIKNITRQQAIEIYRRDWWVKYGYERIEDQQLAAKIFDLAVNMGPGAAHRLLQAAINHLNPAFRDLDGIIGTKTILAINALPPDQLLEKFLWQAKRYYELLNKPKCLAGWMNRLYS